MEMFLEPQDDFLEKSGVSLKNKMVHQIIIRIFQHKIISVNSDLILNFIFRSYYKKNSLHQRRNTFVCLHVYYLRVGRLGRMQANLIIN